MSTIRITKEFRYEGAHALYNYDGKCKNIHGHSYILYVTDDLWCVGILVGYWLFVRDIPGKIYANVTDYVLMLQIGYKTLKNKGKK